MPKGGPKGVTPGSEVGTGDLKNYETEATSGESSPTQLIPRGGDNQDETLHNGLPTTSQEQ